MILKTINGGKPALVGLWPNFKGMNIVLDLLLNVMKNLVEFSEMGSAYIKLFIQKKKKSALLNVGSKKQGTEVTKGV